MRTLHINFKPIFFATFLLSVSFLYPQHTVNVTTPEGQTYTLSGDTLKYSFKAKVAALKAYYQDAAKFQSLAIKANEFNVDEEHLALYDLGCYFSLNGDAQKSVDYIKQSFQAGFDDVPHILFDKDLDGIRSSKPWQKTLAPFLHQYFFEHNKEIAIMFGEDQKPRLSGQKIDWKVLKVEDAKRRVRVKELVEQNTLKTAHDYYKTAFIMHHGEDAEDYRLANELAERAFEFEKPHQMAPWLSAATKDRLLLSKEEKQWYGTQGVTYLKENKKVGIDPRKIDTTAVSSEERLRRNAPTIEQLREYIANFNEGREIYLRKQKENKNKNSEN